MTTVAAFAESPRERFLQAAEAVLQDLGGRRFWGGSYPNTPRVEREFKQPFQVNEFPHLILLQDAGSRIGGLATHDQDGADFHDEFHLAIYGYVQGDDVVTASTWLERLNRDVKLALWSAMAPLEPLRGLALRLRFDEDEDAQFEGAFGSFVLPITAELSDALRRAA